MQKVKKLNIQADANGINLDVDGAPEGIHIEYEILPEVLAAINEAASQWRELPGSGQTADAEPEQGLETRVQQLEHKVAILTTVLGFG